MSEFDLVPLTTAQSALEAHMICALLADHGIPAHVPGENAMDWWSIALRTLAVRVEVPAGRLDDARRILEEKREEIAAGEHQLDDDCEVPGHDGDA